MDALVGLMLVLAFLGTLDLDSLKSSLAAHRISYSKPVYRPVTLKVNYDFEYDIYTREKAA